MYINTGINIPKNVWREIGKIDNRPFVVSFLSVLPSNHYKIRSNSLPHNVPNEI